MSHLYQDKGNHRSTMTTTGQHPSLVKGALLSGYGAGGGEGQSIDTAHEDMIHDAQMDYYGRRLASCSSDSTVKIFQVDGTESYQLLQTLKGHQGPVWQVAWAHPKFGSILASASYDTTVIIWRQNPADGQYVKIKRISVHSGSVNGLSWAPHQWGLSLACASSDGRISIVTYQEDGTWDTQIIQAHSIGCNAVSWAPSAIPSSLVTANPSPSDSSKRFVSGGCDNVVKVWVAAPEGGWKEEATLNGHSDWVRDVAWAPNVGLPNSYIASCGQDKSVLIWTKTSAPGSTWTSKRLSGKSFPDVVWRVSWSMAGNLLAVSCGDNQVTLWKETLGGEWMQVSETTSEGVSSAPNPMPGN